MEEKPAVGMRIGTGSDYDLVSDETLFRVNHRHHLHFTRLSSFVHRHGVNFVKILVQLDAFLAGTRFIEWRTMTTYVKKLRKGISE